MKRWSESALDKIRSMCESGYTAAEIAEEFQVPITTIRGVTQGHGIRFSPHKRLTDEQERWLRREYPHMSNKICALYLGVSVNTIAWVAQRMRLRKTEQYNQESRAWKLKKARERKQQSQRN